MGTLNVNLIADNGGGSNVDMQCEGSNTSNLAQGLAKAYFCHTTDSQIEASFNVASVVDNQQVIFQSILPMRINLLIIVFITHLGLLVVLECVLCMNMTKELQIEQIYFLSTIMEIL